MKNKFYWIFAVLLLAAMALTAFFSTKNDTLTFDEVAHIGAGYSYLTQQDYRMNPEHPPLIKDLAAIPLLFLNLNFPQGANWTQASPAVWWHQFDFGHEFIYSSGNNPDQIFSWTRISMILVLVLFTFFVFFWAKKLWGKKAGLIALFISCFFPTFLAHGRLVTTDIGAALGATLATYFWLEFLKNKTKKSLIFAGLAFGLAMLIKFSLILLIPFFAIITFVFAWLQDDGARKFMNLLKYGSLGILAGIIGVVFVIWPVYTFQVSGYPRERQIKDTIDLLNTTNIPDSIIKINILLDQNKITRPLGEYFLGILTAGNRTTTGNTTYFMGQVSADSWKSYFPIVYLIKNPLPFHILTLIALFFGLWKIKKPFWKNAPWRAKEWIKNHFAEFSMVIFLAIYWTTSLISNLNIGVRHLMPIFPFTILLVSGLISKWLNNPYLKLKYAFLIILFAWQAISVIAIYPHFLSYFNEIIGGSNNGYKYVVDSNLDWGQDLKRLETWLKKNSIDKIYIDYFGGGDLDYYLGKDKYIVWDHAKNNPSEVPKGSYFAVSINQMQGGRAKPTQDYNGNCSYYGWLNNYTPIARIGYSIFVYKID